MGVRYPITGGTAIAIAASIERAVGAGELSPGSLLPPIRELGRRLGVNSNTAAAAYRTLRDRGIIETNGRHGSRVRHRPATTPRSTPPPPVSADVRDLATGMPNPALLPDLMDALGRTPYVPATYGVAAVSPRLAAGAIGRLRADGVPVGDEIGVFSGALDAIDRVLAAYHRPGDPVAVEDPSWANLLDLLAAFGLVPVPVAVDDDGPIPDDVERAARRGARSFIVTSRAQNPTGAAVSSHRADQLRPRLADFSLLIEDDHGAEVAGAPLNSLSGHTPHWAYIRSVSKAYGPDLRVAVMAGDETSLDRVRGRQRLGPSWVSHLLQETVASLWQDEDVARGVEATRDMYAARRGAVIEQLAERGIAAHGKSGLNVWVPVPDEAAALTGLLAAGWAVAPGGRFRLRSEPAVRVTITTLAEDEVPTLVAAIASTISARRSYRIPGR